MFSKKLKKNFSFVVRKNSNFEYFLKEGSITIIWRKIRDSETLP